MGKQTTLQHLETVLLSRARLLLRQAPGARPAAVVAQVIAELGHVIQLDGRVSTLADRVEAALRDNASPEPEAATGVTAEREPQDSDAT